MPKVMQIITTIDMGGAEKHLLLLTRGLIQLGYKITVVYLKGKGELKDNFEKTGAQVARFTSLINLVRLMRLQRPQIVHTHRPKAELVGNIAAWLAGVPVILSTKHANEEPLKMLHLRFLHLLMSVFDDAIICISDCVKDYTKKISVWKRKILERIHYGLDIDEFKSMINRDKLAKIRQELADDRRYLIGTVARLDVEKGVEYLIRAAGILTSYTKDFRVAIFGDGSMRQAYEKLSNDLGLSDFIKFCGRTSEIPSAIKAFDVFVLPSSGWEGFGLVLLEAMAAKVPIVATRVGAIPEVLDKAGILVNPMDPLELSNAIKMVLDDRKLARDLVESAYKQLCERFDAGRMIEQTHRLYQKLLHD